MNIKKTLLDDTLPPDNMSARSATEIVERMKSCTKRRFCFWQIDYRNYGANSNSCAFYHGQERTDAATLKSMA